MDQNDIIDDQAQFDSSFDDLDQSKSNSVRKTRNTFCGTPYYVSPEMLEDSLGLPQSDLWALGCIIYRMHTAEMPFEGPNEMETFDLICSRTLKWPENMSEETIDIIDKLLQLDPRKRIGSTNFDEIKKHPYFSQIDFTTLHTTRPPLESEFCFVESQDAPLEPESPLMTVVS